MMTQRDFIIIGAGSAGRTAAEELAATAGGRKILLVDIEPRLPYKRTSISKYVADGFGPDDFAVHDVRWYEESGIELRVAARVSRIDPESRGIEIDGEEIGYGSLLLAVGAEPVPPADLPAGLPMSTLWSVEDGLKLQRDLSGCRRVAILGSGVLGVEAAWQCRRMGIDTLLLGRDPHPMGKYLDFQCAQLLTTAMTDGGVRFVPGESVSDVGPISGGAVRVRTDRDSYETEYVIVAAGSRPVVELARRAGLAVNRGILVDSSLRTSVPGIRAAGDCAEHPGGRVTGLWHSAEHQGRLAAAGMLGEERVFTDPPFRLKCEVFGGFWFSAGPVTAPAVPGGLPEAETWEAGGVLWRPRFQQDRLVALSGAAPGGMDPAAARSAQKLMMSRALREEVRAALADSGAGTF